MPSAAKVVGGAATAIFSILAICLGGASLNWNTTWLSGTADFDLSLLRPASIYGNRALPAVTKSGTMVVSLTQACITIPTFTYGPVNISISNSCAAVGDQDTISRVLNSAGVVPPVSGIPFGDAPAQGVAVIGRAMMPLITAAIVLCIATLFCIVYGQWGLAALYTLVAFILYIIATVAYVGGLKKIAGAAIRPTTISMEIGSQEAAAATAFAGAAFIVSCVMGVYTLRCERKEEPKPLKAEGGAAAPVTGAAAPAV